VRKGLVQTKGGDRKSNGQNVHLKSYSEQAAEALGVDERTVRRELARGKKIAPDVLSEVSGTDMDKGAVLDELASTPVAEQRAKLAEITLRRQEVEQTRRAAEAVNRDTDRAIAENDSLLAAVCAYHCLSLGRVGDRWSRYRAR
jgi:hypothetical protein